MIIFMNNVGIIGGSGFYGIEGEYIGRVDTPWGQSGDVVLQQKKETSIYFLARHGKGHTVPPHLINYRANIYALKKLGVTHILATNAVGSCRESMKPGDFVIPDNILDFTSGRDQTFYEGAQAGDVPEEFKKVKHTDVTFPFHEETRDLLMKTLERRGIPYHNKGVLAAANGPRYETSAEVKMARQLGGDILGMTSAPEVFLARELGIKYATIAVVTNFGAGMQSNVSHDEVVEIFGQKIELVKKIIIDCAVSI